MKISVIMASYLQMPNKSNQGQKFIRAVKSFLNQSYQGDKELIVVADGCQITMELFHQNFSGNPQLKIIPIPKQPPYSGEVRNEGIRYTTGEIITYLDADDVMGKNHLQIIYDQFANTDLDWCYYDDFLILNKEFTKLQTRIVEPRYGSIGTSSITHKHPKLLKNGERFKFLNGYGHDFCTVMLLNSLGTKFKKLDKKPEYIVCHYHLADF